MIILETYTTQKGTELQLPDFLEVVTEITDDSTYSMYNLSRRVESGTSPAKRTIKKEEEKLTAVDSNILKEQLNGPSNSDVITNGTQ